MYSVLFTIFTFLLSGPLEGGKEREREKERAKYGKNAENEYFIAQKFEGMKTNYYYYWSFFPIKTLKIGIEYKIKFEKLFNFNLCDF